MSENITSPKSFRRPTAVAATVIGMGLVASIAGNVQSIILQPGAPSVGAMISAFWWPALLFAMIELAIHTPWGTGGWRVIQWMGAGVIGGLAFYISYFHLAHVLSYFGYDVISRYAGPITVDVAMMVATLAMHRVGVAKRAEVASVATSGGQTEVASDTMASLASDWDGLEEELASYVATEQAKPVSAPPAPEPEAAPEPESVPEPAQPAQDRATVSTLTKVPAEAAKRITEALEEDPKATAAAIARDLVAAGLAESDRSGRRYVAAVKNGTARVS
jgi:hypothetical protein